LAIIFELSLFKEAFYLSTGKKKTMAHLPIDPEDAFQIKQLNEGALYPFLHRGKRLVATRVGEKLLAFERRCPHENADLAHGKVEDCHIICPRHHFRFSLLSGRQEPVGLFLNTYPIEEKENELGIYYLDSFWKRWFG